MQAQVGDEPGASFWSGRPPSSIHQWQLKGLPDSAIVSVGNGFGHDPYAGFCRVALTCLGIIANPHKRGEACRLRSSLTRVLSVNLAWKVGGDQATSGSGPNGLQISKILLDS